MMNFEKKEERLAELRVEFDGVHAEVDDAVRAAIERSPIDVAGFDADPRLVEHLAHFLPPRDSCPMCESSIHATMWALHHGATRCSNCGYPGRYYHFIGEYPRVVVLLFAHPSEVEVSR